MTAISTLSAVLTQEEIDALLPSRAVRSVCLIKPKKNSFPHLEKKASLLATQLQSAFSKIVKQANVNVSLKSISSQKTKDYYLDFSSMIVAKYTHNISVLLDKNFAFLLIDASLGGTRGLSIIQTTQRPYTCIEKSILIKFLTSLQTHLTTVLNEPITFEKIETNLSFTNTLNENLVIAHFDVKMDSLLGNLDLILADDTYTKEDTLENSSLSNKMMQALQQVPLTLKAILDTQTVPLKNVLLWKKNDIIPLSYYDGKSVNLSVQNDSLFTGKLKKKDKSLLIEITRKNKG